MKTFSGMLELLDSDLDLTITGSDGDDDGKSGDDDKDKKTDDDKSKDDKSDKQDSDKDKEPTSITLTGADLRTWNNLQEERDRIHGEKREMAQKVKDAEAARDEAVKNAGAEDAKKQITDLTTERDALKSSNEDLQVQLAFLRQPGYDWVDPDAALKLADLSKVDRDKDGKVIATSLKVELDRLAKDKPYLLKPKDDADDKDDDKSKDPKKSGDPAPQKQKTSKDQAARDAELRRKYPGLRR